MILVTGAPAYPWLQDEPVKGDIADYDFVEALLRFDRPAILNFVPERSVLESVERCNPQCPYFFVRDWPGHDRRCAIDAAELERDRDRHSRATVL
ncbi:hypothetical protein [Rhizobium sp. NXC14]|uniref:hypothetical protein n=1 Tax=Rhizobium sp. NXC14 TaxID=1981173 RepID=UPI000A26AAC2|nr:hypothetical protein [Rhizobium sp. NXC14]